MTSGTWVPKNVSRAMTLMNLRNEQQADIEEEGLLGEGLVDGAGGAAQDVSDLKNLRVVSTGGMCVYVVCLFVLVCVFVCVCVLF